MRTGRPPKPDGQKVTRHASTKAQTVIPARGRAGKCPEPIQELSGDAGAVWAALWKLPEATMWTPADLPALTRLVWLQTSPTSWLDSRLLAEMRQLEDRFGLNPQARQALGWVIDGGSTKQPTSAGQKPAGPDRKGEAMRLIRGEAG